MIAVTHLSKTGDDGITFMACGIDSRIKKRIIHSLEYNEFIKLEKNEQCKVCLRAINIKKSAKNIRESLYYNNNRSLILHQRRKNHVNYRETHPIKSILRCCRTNARNRNKTFSITEQDVVDILKIQHGKCYYTGVDILIGCSTNNPYQLSIDRKDSNLGYDKDNIVLCCQSINFAKSNFTESDFISFLNDVINTNAKEKAWEAFKAAKELMWGPMTRYGEEVAKKDFEKHWEENK